MFIFPLYKTCTDHSECRAVSGMRKNPPGQKNRDEVMRKGRRNPARNAPRSRESNNLCRGLRLYTVSNNPFQEKYAHVPSRSAPSCLRSAAPLHARGLRHAFRRRRGEDAREFCRIRRGNPRDGRPRPALRHGGSSVGNRLEHALGNAPRTPRRTGRPLCARSGRRPLDLSRHGEAPGRRRRPRSHRPLARPRHEARGHDRALDGRSLGERRAPKRTV